MEEADEKAPLTEEKVIVLFICFKIYRKENKKQILQQQKLTKS